MNKIKHIIYQAIFFLPILLTSACSNEEVPGQDNNGEKVPVTFRIGGQYTAMYNNQSKTRATTNEHLTDDMILPLKEGSSVWIIAKKSNGTTTKQGYVVKTADGGIQSLYPCSKFDENGGYNEEDVSITPLFLEEGDYTFSAVSPAKSTLENDLTYPFDNGEYVIATNNSWTQTQATTVHITGSEGVVMLNPLMQVGSRLTFTLKPGKNIAAINLLSPGIEIDGIKKNAPSYKVGDNLEIAMGDKYNRIFISEKDFVRNAETKEMFGEIGIIPTDCTAQHVTVTLNMEVNGVPTPYSFSIVGKQFKPGYSYNYTINVNIKDGITIATYQENSWSYDAKPQ